MNELDNSAGSNRRGGWLEAIVGGVVVCLLVASLLSAFLMYLLPQFVDPHGMDAYHEYVSNVLGVAVWVVSLALGGWQVWRHSPKD